MSLTIYWTPDNRYWLSFLPENSGHDADPANFTPNGMQASLIGSMHLF
jgi:hypothetical protein